MAPPRGTSGTPGSVQLMYPVASLTELAATPSALGVLLDLDGTLAPIVPDPDGVAIPDSIRASLETLAPRVGLLGFISGRSLDDLRRIVGMDGVVYSGNHGTQIRDRDGSTIDAGVGDLSPLHTFAAEWDAADLETHGLWLEDKGATLTFHYRNAPDVPAARAYLDATVAPRGRDAGLRVEPGRMSLEVHPPGDTSKGTAVRAIFARYPQIRSVISVGDDRTDVTVWLMLRELHDEGRIDRAKAVGVMSTETPAIVRESADTVIDGVPGTAALLADLAARLP